MPKQEYLLVFKEASVGRGFVSLAVVSQILNAGLIVITSQSNFQLFGAGARTRDVTFAKQHCQFSSENICAFQIIESLN